MKLHNGLAECVYLSRTQGDIVEKRRQAKLDLAKHEAAEAEKKRQREEEDAVAAAVHASLLEAAGVNPKTKKRRRTD